MIGKPNNIYSPRQARKKRPKQDSQNRLWSSMPEEGWLSFNNNYRTEHYISLHCWPLGHLKDHIIMLL